MAHINCSALLPFSNAIMFELVNDVAAYPDYMDGCVGAEVIRSEVGLLVARLDLARGGIRQSFTTRNNLDAPSSIHMQLEEGPFSRFDGRWFFQNLGDDGCKVILDLQFDMTSKIAGLAVRHLFESVSNNLVDAVCRRARTLYGKKQY